MSAWNLADVWEVAADVRSGALAVVQGARQYTWSELDRRADAVAAGLLGFDLQHQDKVAQYLYNCPEYLESVYASFKVGLVPVNTNYRYADDELVYLWNNGDVRVVVFHGTASRVSALVSPTSRPGYGSMTAADPAHHGQCRTSISRGSPPPAGPPARPGVGARTTFTFCTPGGRRECPRASCGARTIFSRCSIEAPASVIRKTEPWPTFGPDCSRPVIHPLVSSRVRP